jgi:hypothetical protein
MVCAGDSSELCGDSNRIQVYEDSTWTNPTAADLVAIIQQYNNTVAQAVAAVAQYKSDITALQATEAQSPGSKVRRRSLTETETIEMQEIRNDYQVFQSLQEFLGS